MLDDVIANSIKGQLTIERVLAFVYLRRLKRIGCPIHLGDSARFQRRIKATIDSGRVDIPISKARLKTSGISECTLLKTLQRPISSLEWKTYERTFSRASNAAAQSAMGYLATEYARRTQSEGKGYYEQLKTARGQFRLRIARDWGKPLDSLDTIIDLTRDIGEITSERLQAAEAHSDFQENKYEAVSKLFARLCQVADEISTLLRSGFADGAEARWRSLYELQVVLRVLIRGSEELAERYLHHHDIDLFNEVKSMLSLGARKKPKAALRQFNELEVIRKDLLERFGQDFGAPYGWASALLGHRAGKFTDIEAHAGSSQLNFHYKAASANVHASARGTLTRVGVPRDFPGLLAGACNYGLSNPARKTISSLSLAAIDMATYSGSLEVMTRALAMQHLGATTIDQFDAQAARLDGREPKKTKRHVISVGKKPSRRRKRSIKQRRLGHA